MARGAAVARILGAVGRRGFGASREQRHDGLVVLVHGNGPMGLPTATGLGALPGWGPMREDRRVVAWVHDGRGKKEEATTMAMRGAWWSG